MVCQKKNSICPNAHCLQIKIGAFVKIENDAGQHLWVATKEMHLTLLGGNLEFWCSYFEPVARWQATNLHKIADKSNSFLLGEEHMKETN